MQVLGLLGLLFLALTLPLSVRHVEERLEVYFLLMGAGAVSLQGFWSLALLGQALREPLPICAVVLVVGLGFRALRLRVRAWAGAGQHALGVRLLAFSLVVGLGLLSALITSVVAALVLAEVVNVLKLPRRTELRLVILTCFAIGAGSALTPLGGPLAAIAVSRLQGDLYHADLFFLSRVLGAWVLPLIGILGLSAAALVHGPDSSRPGLKEDGPETLRDILMQASKVYGFVAGLVLFGRGFAPLADRYLTRVPTLALYWINSLSAVLDNATLTAIEIGPQLPLERIRALLLGLLISGGMLVPGNLPNIICAAKLRLGAKEWAAFALPVGLVAMVVVFATLAFV
jgi:predicted cation transporter